MLHNYHTHTPRCNHASGTEEEYVLAAIEGGFATLGFADHSPYIYPGDYVSGLRMRPEELPGYVAVLRELREKYRDKIDIRIGVETEYFPDFFPQLLPYLQEQGVEYIIMGQHCPRSELDGIWCYGSPPVEAMLSLYTRTCMEGLNTGLYTYIAHPDVCPFEGPDEVYTRYMRALCREAKGCGVPLELNLLGIRDGRYYPVRRFWEIAAEEGCPTVLGWDAHQPEALMNTDQVTKAMAMVQELGLPLLEKPQIRPLK